MKKQILDYVCIVIGSILYAISTILFIFPYSTLLGGTSGISVILNQYFSLSPSNISTCLNVLLIVLAFIMLGKEMAIKTLVGSALTTFFIWLLGHVFGNEMRIVPNIYVSTIAGAAIIAVASGIMFYVKSSSGGTDIVALILKKYTKLHIGIALLITDILIVLIGGFILGINILLCSFLGLLIKTLGIDLIIFLIKKIGIKQNVFM